MATSALEQFRAGGSEQWSAVAGFERLAFTSKVTSRAAQIILEEASMPEAAAFATGLRGHVRNAVLSKHANHVVQKITEVMPAARASFVVDELKGFGQEIARHCFGCRVLCRILEHLSPSDVSTMQLVEEVLADLQDLCSHSFGSFVVRHLLEFGLPQHRHRVAMALRADLAGYAKHKFGSHVVEGALRHASFDDQQVLARELLGDKEQLMFLASNQFGRHVVRALLATPGSLKKEAVDALRPMEGQLRASRYGKSVLQALRGAASA
jgi:pumilio RNA-binding family